MELGEQWAFRTSTASGKFHEVEVLMVGEKSPPKVKIRFVDDKWEGETRWVPTSRLEVPWGEIDEYSAAVGAMAAVYKVSVPPVVEAQAAETVFFEALDTEGVAWLRSPRRGVTEVYDLPALAQAAGMLEEDLLVPPVAFEEGVHYLAWPTTLRIAQALAAKHAERIMAYVTDKEEIGRRESILGHDVPKWVRGEAFHVSGEDAWKGYEKRVKPEMDVLRRWAGANALVLDVLELQAELSRVGSVAARAIAEVRRLRSNRIADALFAELMDPLSTFVRDNGNLTPGERKRLLDTASHFEWTYRPPDKAIDG